MLAALHTSLIIKINDVEFASVSLVCLFFTLLSAYEIISYVLVVIYAPKLALSLNPHERKKSHRSQYIRFN